MAKCYLSYSNPASKKGSQQTEGSEGNFGRPNLDEALAFISGGFKQCVPPAGRQR
ncbi:hypothetical protein KY284_027367 [Solanum tuberosum]|nr:hypothetical protein KY284_027367 [Solanum tuberosum]